MAGTDVVVARDYCLTDVWAVLPDRIVECATIVVHDGLIASIVENGPPHGRPISGQGSVCIPGIVDVHSVAGFQADLDGVTTQLHAIRVTDGQGGNADLEPMLCTGALPPDPAAPVDHRPHVCIDLDHGTDLEEATRCVQACTRDPGGLVVSITDIGASGPASTSRATERAATLDWFAIQAVAHRIRLISRGPVTADDVDRAVDWGAIAIVFPATIEAARRAHERGLHVIGSATDLLVHPEVHAVISPYALVELGLCDALASAQRPSSLIDAVSLLVLRGVCDLRKAVGLVTSVPADIIGLTDRGRLAVGRRGDMTLLRPDREHFRVRQTFRAGEPVRAGRGTLASGPARNGRPALQSSP
ncbi:MAG TPA: amidohydrolase family protein [Ilumatobacteraceae bacterium]|nr:amidohydrolase family protein [Ilumatobacteraceae bacterium]